MKKHPAVVNDGIVTLQGINGLQINLNKGLTLEQVLDKAVPAGSKFAFKKLISSLAGKTAGGVVNIALTGSSLNNYPSLSDRERHRANVQTAESMLIYHIFQREITTQTPSMLNGMDSSIIINSPSLWDMFYRSK